MAGRGAVTRPSRLLRAVLGVCMLLFASGVAVAVLRPGGMSGLDAVMYGLLSGLGVVMVAGRFLDELLAGHAVSVAGLPLGGDRSCDSAALLFGALVLYSGLWLCFLGAGLLVSRPPSPLPGGVDVFYGVLCAVGWTVAVVKSCVAGGRAVAAVDGR
jgi:hypothetical protein